MRALKTREAIREATLELMREHPEVFLLGVGLVDPKGVFSTISGALQEFGSSRVVEGPLAEQMLTGVALGAATTGLRPILIHHRMDFLLLSMDQIVNHLAKWRFMFPGQYELPVVIRAIVGRGWGNGPQHTQSLQSMLANVPGLKVVVPSNAYDAKGLLVYAVRGQDPVIFIEHRWIHEDTEEVPQGLYEVPIGKAKVVQQGNDVSLLAIGPALHEAIAAGKMLADNGISAEIIDLRSAQPVDWDTIRVSIRKTGRLIAVDSDWKAGGVASRIIAEVCQSDFGALKAPPACVAWPDHPVPSSHALETKHYPGASDIAVVIGRMFKRDLSAVSPPTPKSTQGPF